MSYPSRCYGEEGARLDQAFHLTFEGNERPCNILLMGDSGIGKSYILNYLAKEYNVTVHSAVIGELAATYQGHLSRGFKRLIWKATEPSEKKDLVLIEDLDLFFSRNTSEAQDSELLPMFSQFLKQRKVMVVAITQRPEQVVLDIRSQFDDEIHLQIPTPRERAYIMQHIYYNNFEDHSHISLDDIKQLSSRAHGFVAADLMHWFQLAEEAALSKGSDKVTGLETIMAEKPEPVYWTDIGGLTTAKHLLEESAVWIYKHAEAYERLGIRPSKGLLLHGPPGTGKTLLAKAVATESSANFLAISIPDLIKGEVGESEKAVSRIFQTSIRCSPCVVFLDELEAIFSSRDASGDVGKKLISQFLIEMDHLDKSNASVIILGATNYPEAIDDSILRPGRLDRLIYIGPPNVDEREQILQVLKQSTKLDPSVDLKRIAQLSEGYTGADLKAVIRKAGLLALKSQATSITQEHIECALDSISPSNK
ncbi:hypothetical protein G6F57_005107 [Rhizopus arrhizus]|uniref:AAA+ ATPase domain-containing protein n=1 Tax=Rhizopus oryzae TaxID=64495 RepID=A0A9P7BSJ8_RHIOR|nr:hypothetical protein G6F23_008970 [Rhizopus arrhizus]KAG1422380.1 hypothetical protein G6F58_003338 [Rhizopus delemar]KAG0766012.1 hypothetical protein G6F24_003952 [Rhizopus arrhizus]KAG0793758.1 hypothetical protein G6F21_003381 [Rhizopus arrhizus]KAG0801358.1 hypothetical protein G6F22_001323 [Rhizopus arrhizus]